MHNFCALFDSNYLSRALVMYRSLKATGEDFILYAVCFDDLAYEILSQCAFSNLVAIPPYEFEFPELLSVKKKRTAGEYCWTCTLYVIRYCLDTFNLGEITYLDAVLCFYEKPGLLLDEFEQSGASVLITPHRHNPRYDQSATSGVYCVQFMAFKVDERGKSVLQWWQDRSLERCYDRIEDGKFGDQKYLDYCPQQFEGIHVLEHIGGGVALWNVQQYQLNYQAGKLYADAWPLVFYHFHAYKQYTDNVHELRWYELAKPVLDILYKSYVQSLRDVHEEILKVAPDFDRGRSIRALSWIDAITQFTQTTQERVQ